MRHSSEVLEIFVAEIEECIALLRDKPNTKKQKDLLELIESSSKCIGASDIHSLVTPFTAGRKANSVLHVAELTRRLDGQLERYREALRANRLKVSGE